MSVEAPCLKVPKKCGERAIKLLKRLNLLATSLKIGKKRAEDAGDISPMDEFLYVPLLKEPDAAHIEEFAAVLPGFEVTRHKFPKRVKYSMSAIDLARDLLPATLVGFFPRSIDFIGDIAVVEVPSELKDYKQIIGEAVLRAHRNVRTVLAKAGVVSGVHRLREFEVIAGEGRTETVHREYGCSYHLDLVKVYFSPRLSYEHNRVASQVAEGETVIDMFAGIGPFSILIAKKHSNVEVYAIDVNPEAVKYLKENIMANGVQGKVVPILGDAKEVVSARLAKSAERVIMNLPERAIEFFGSACEALKPKGGIIHFYDFEGGPNPVETAKRKLAEAVENMDYKIERVLSARAVREVAPYKWQVVLDIRIGRSRS